MIRAVKALKSRSKTTFFCLSNANSVFINTILQVRLMCIQTHAFLRLCNQSKGLEDLFTEIVTNPAEWEPSGLLKLRRRVDPSGPQHSCKVGCSPNMCKGMTCMQILRLATSHPTLSGEELQAFLERHQPGFDRMIYIGDGSNDFCPILRFRKYAPRTRKSICPCS